jgi:pilus assembly protein Flp/PilA
VNWTTRVTLGDRPRRSLGDRLRRLAISLTVRSRDEHGATAVEYALMLALIAVVIVGAVTLLGQSTSQPFVDVQAGFGGS